MWGPGLAESDAVTFFAVLPVSNCSKFRIYCDYFENKAETKKMVGGNIDLLDELFIAHRWEPIPQSREIKNSFPFKNYTFLKN